MDKRRVVEEIQGYLVEQLRGIMQAAESARDAATAEESKPENQYDTRGLEASYLAGAQAQRAQEIQQLLVMYRFLPVREYGREDVVCPGALVELDLDGTRAHYFIAPNGGGLIANVDGKPVQVITPQSPLGEALLGRKVGDIVEVEIRGKMREYEIVSMT